MKAFVYEKAGVSRLEDFPEPSRASRTARSSACSPARSAGRTSGPGSTATSGSPRRASPATSCAARSSRSAPSGRASRSGSASRWPPPSAAAPATPARRGYTNLCDNLQTIGFQFNGGFAEYMEVPPIAFDQRKRVRTPDVPDEEAALAEPIACVVNGQEFLHIEPRGHGGDLRLGLHRLHARGAGAHERRARR